MTVAIVASAIKTHYWQELYQMFCKNETKFQLIFVGNVKPTWSLPDNFTYIYSELDPPACFEMAYQFAHETLDPDDYIFHIADDLIFEESFLDSLVKGYEKTMQQYPDRMIMVGTHSFTTKQGIEGYHVNSLYAGGPAHCHISLGTIEDSKIVGGIDKRFKAVYWDYDRLFRFYQKGGILTVLDEKDCPSLEERPNEHGLYTKNCHSDLNTLNMLWDITESADGSTIYTADDTCFKNSTLKNTFSKKPFCFKRTSEVIEI